MIIQSKINLQTVWNGSLWYEGRKDGSICVCQDGNEKLIIKELMTFHIHTELHINVLDLGSHLQSMYIRDARFLLESVFMNCCQLLGSVCGLFDLLVT